MHDCRNISEKVARDFPPANNNKLAGFRREPQRAGPLHRRQLVVHFSRNLPVVCRRLQYIFPRSRESPAGARSRFFRKIATSLACSRCFRDESSVGTRKICEFVGSCCRVFPKFARTLSLRAVLLKSASSPKVLEKNRENSDGERRRFF